MKRKSLPTGRDFLFVEGYGNENPGAFQPTRPLRGATTGLVHRLSAFDISTHAPLAGRDVVFGMGVKNDGNFNPRAPCGARRFDSRCCNIVYCISTHAPLAGRDTVKLLFRAGMILFQPTRPLRGATFSYLRKVWNRYDFNPRAPCGARLTVCINIRRLT